MARMILLCCIIGASASCVAAAVLGQALPMLVDLAGNAFGLQHAKTVGGLLNLMGSFSGTEQPKTSEQKELLEIDFDIVKQIGGGSSSSVMTLSDGDVLTPKDNYKIAFSVNRPCYVYIFQIDSTTKIDIIVPEEGERYSFRPGGSVYATAGSLPKGFAIVRATASGRVGRSTPPQATNGSTLMRTKASNMSTLSLR